jgi:transposase InsO family protein
VKLHPFIEAEKVAGDSINRCCRLLEVSRSAFYERIDPTPTKKELADGELLATIRQIHTESKGTYGVPRVHEALRKLGIACGAHRIRRLMRRAGMEGRCKKRFRTTTIADPEFQGALDLIQREFGTGATIDRRYVGDITYISTWEGWAYLATVIDLSSRRVVGWALDSHMRTELVTDALKMAISTRGPAAGVVFIRTAARTHNTSKDYALLAKRHGVALSIGRRGQCWDNAVAESFFATIKRELISQRAWPTREALRRAVFDYIEGWFNTKRLHSSLNYCSPAEWESAHCDVVDQAA